MALYDKLTSIDIITPIQNDYKIRYTKDCEPVVLLESVYVATPWLHHRKVADRQCAVWHIYFKKYGIIPQGCRQCWKVVMKIKTLQGLFDVNEKQAMSDYNCKCGLETRPMTGGIGGYRAFWYAPMDKGLAGGRKMFRKVQMDFPGVKLILKRGCTEFENVYHPSDKWDEKAQELAWDMKEELINALFLTQRTRPGGTPKVLQPSIIRKWIEWAYEHHEATGDDSWSDYLEGPPMPNPKTYNSSGHKDKDYEQRTEYLYPNEIDSWITVQERSNTEGPGLGEIPRGGIGADILLFDEVQKN